MSSPLRDTKKLGHRIYFSSSVCDHYPMELALKGSARSAFASDSILEQIFHRVEFFRIRTHLQLAEKTLRARNTDHLSKELKKQRKYNLDNLHEYWSHGKFPKNTDTLSYTPYFRDRYGTFCAMGYVVENSGGHAIVQHVQQTNNNVYIKDVYDGPIVEWLKKSGLTKEEAAYIQPTYGPCGFNGCAPSPIPQYVQWIPWIFMSSLFLVFEVLNYAISNRISNDNSIRKSLLRICFTFINLVFAFSVTFALSRFLGISFKGLSF